jgi:uncharacterized protein YhaN
VNLLRCQIQGFGRLLQRSFAFADGLNVVFAANESGKTTLQRCLTALLYGPLRADVKNQRRMEAWTEQYKPWHGSEYGGILWCRLASGRELELYRSFSRDDPRFEIRTASGENLTAAYEQQKNGDVLFARTHLGMPKELFESVALVRENRAAELGNRECIRERTANLAHAGDEDLSVRATVEKLETALETIGSDRAPTRPYRQTLDLVEQLRVEKKALEERRHEFESWMEERNRWAAAAENLERELRAARRITLAARRREAAARVRMLEEIKLDIVALNSRIEETGGDPAFPADRLEELGRLTAATESLAGRLREMHSEIEASELRLKRAAAEREQLAAYDALHSEVEPEKITEWFVQHLHMARQREDLQLTTTQLREEKAGLERALSGLGPIFSDPSADWEQKVRQASDLERTCNQQMVNLSEKIAGERAREADARARAGAWQSFGGLAGVLALLAAGLSWFASAPPMPPVYLLAVAGLLGLALILLYSLAARSRKMQRQIQSVLSELEASQAQARDESQRIQAPLKQALVRSGLRTMEAFLAAAKKAEQLRHRLSDLTARAAQAEQQRDSVSAECENLYSRLKEVLAVAGLTCSPATLKAQVDVLRANLRRYRDLEARWRTCEQNHSVLIQEMNGLTREESARTSGIQSILSEAGVSSPEAFREACRARQLVIELQDRKASRTREFRQLCGPMDLEGWQARLRELEKAEDDAGPLPAAGPPGEAGGIQTGAPFLPYLPAVEECEAKEKRVTDELSAAREEHARLAERVRHAFQNYRGVSEVEEDLAAAAATLDRLEKNRKALQLAAEALRTISRRRQETLAPQLNRAVEQRFLRLCAGRYQEVRIDPDFRLAVREPGSGELRSSESLSRGTQDQLYFALRFGILDLVANPDEPAPCFLDEPFAAYDRVRLLEAFAILDEEAQRRQLFLFTCREDLRDLSRDRRAHLVSL